MATRSDGKKHNPHVGHRNRLREQARKNGLGNLHPHQVLELMLFTTIKRKDTNELGHALIDHCGDFKDVFTADVEKLTELTGIGRRTALYLKAMFEVYAKYGGFRNSGHIYLDTPLVMDAFYSKCFKRENGEQLAVTTVDGSLAMVNNRVIEYTADPERRVELIRGILACTVSVVRHGVILAQYSPKDDDITAEEQQAACAIIDSLSPILRVHKFVFLRNDGVRSTIYYA